MTDYSELKAAALAASPGPWIAQKDPDRAGYRIITGSRWPIGRGMIARDTDYITAASPEVVLGLIARVEALEATLSQSEEARVHALLESSHRKMLIRLSQEDPLNCPRCSFKRPEPHFHAGDLWEAAPENAP